MTQLEIVSTDLLHIREICETMRAREREALEHLGLNLERTLTHEVASSLLSYAGVIDGECLAIGGAKSVGIFADEAYVWLVCSSHMERMPATFIRGAIKGLRQIEPLFKTIYGLVCTDFERSRRFLEWLGFEIEPPNGGVSLFWRGTRPTDFGVGMQIRDLLPSFFSLAP